MSANSPFCHIFLGPEIGEKQEALENLEKQFSGGGAGNTPDKTIYYASDTSVSVMVSVIRNGSLFADKRIFIIKNAELITDKKDIEILVSCFKSMGNDTLIVLISDETKIDKNLENSVGQSCKRIFYELYENQKQKWIEGFFHRKGMRIGSEAVETILEMTENNTAALKQECSRLCLFLEKGSEVTSAVIEKWLSHTKEETAFMLFSRIANGDLSRSLESLQMLFRASSSGDQDVSAKTLSALAWCFKKLRDYLKLYNAGVSDDFEYKKIGINFLNKKDYAAASRLYNPAKTDKCIALIAEYEVLIRKESSFPVQLLMEKLLYNLVQIGK